MAKTKMKRTVGRRRKSGKKTSTSTRNKKRKNVIRGGMPFLTIIAPVITALYTLAKQNNVVNQRESYDTTNEQLDLLKSIESANPDTITNWIKDDKTKLEPTLPNDFEWVDLDSYLKSARMQEASAKGTNTDRTYAGL